MLEIRKCRILTRIYSGVVEGDVRTREAIQVLARRTMKRYGHAKQLKKLVCAEIPAWSCGPARLYKCLPAISVSSACPQSAYKCLPAVSVLSEQSAAAQVQLLQAARLPEKGACPQSPLLVRERAGGRDRLSPSPIDASIKRSLRATRYPCVSTHTRVERQALSLGPCIHPSVCPCVRA